MKSTGIVRKIDPLGRIVLPMELRRTYDIMIGDGLEIYSDGDKIVLKKYRKSCIFCGNEHNLTKIKDKYICSDCVKEFKEK